MKYTHIFFSALLLVTISTNSIAQNYWQGSTVNTFTPYNVAIGVTSYSALTRFGIYNDLTLGTPVPEIGLLRNTGGSPAGPNFFELAEEITTSGPIHLLDVINHKGYLGILRPIPAEPLDVNGNALIEKNLFAQDDIAIGTNTLPITPWLSRFYIYNDVGVTHIPEIVVNRVNGSNAPDFFELTLQPSGGGSSAKLDVFNNKGWLGILQAVPGAPLDVNGNALIEQNLTVNVNATVNNNLTVGVNATIDNNLQVNNNANVTNDLNVGVDGTVDRYLNVGVAAGINSGVASPLDARLHIYNPFGGSPVHPIGPVVPDIILTHYADDLPHPVANYMEIQMQVSSPLGVHIYNTDVIDGGGDLGIHQANPSEPLDVGGNALVEGNLTVDGNFIVDGTITANNLDILNNLTVGGIAVIGTNGITPPMTIPTGYSLYVSKGILTESVRVALHGTLDWSDYVFAKDYKLMPLSKVADYVKANNHLPEVPSAADVKKDGIDVASMDAALLKKIEELTLYVIQQEKRIDELQKKLDEKNKN